MAGNSVNPQGLPQNLGVARNPGRSRRQVGSFPLASNQNAPSNSWISGSGTSIGVSAAYSSIRLRMRGRSCTIWAHPGGRTYCSCGRPKGA